MVRVLAECGYGSYVAAKRETGRASRMKVPGEERGKGKEGIGIGKGENMVSGEGGVIYDKGKCL